jgi:pimeloyl-ACP methyl ester carboxylesterase
MPSTTIAEPWANKSTNGRSTNARDWRRLGFYVLGWVAPEEAQRRALERFLTPPAPLLNHAKWPKLEGISGDSFRVKMDTQLGGVHETAELGVRLWGRGPAVYLLHGWGGRSTQWSSFIEPLVRAGLTAVVFDAPGHGESPAPRTSIPHFAAALAAVVESVGPAHAVVGHSLGGVATSVALGRGLDAGRVAFIGAPADPTEFFSGYLRQIGLPAHLLDPIASKFEKEYGFDWSELPVRAPRQAPALPALVVHDRDDREVPYASGERIVRAWPDATLMTTTGLGHRRILRDASVIERVVSFASMPLSAPS